MDTLSYKEKLKVFNGTEKYFRELDFLEKLVEPGFNQTVLDIGCGLGTAIKYFQKINRAHYYGYDVVDYTGQKEWFIDKIDSSFNKMYFMHSFAHISEPDKLLMRLRALVMQEIVVVTPNALWLERMRNDKYVPDPTVVKHYNIDELTELFTNAGFKTKACGQFGEYKDGYNERIFYVGTVK